MLSNMRPTWLWKRRLQSNQYLGSSTQWKLASCWLPTCIRSRYCLFLRAEVINVVPSTPDCMPFPTDHFNTESMSDCKMWQPTSANKRQLELQTYTRVINGDINEQVSCSGTQNWLCKNDKKRHLYYKPPPPPSVVVVVIVVVAAVIV